MVFRIFKSVIKYLNIYNLVLNIKSSYKNNFYIVRNTLTCTFTELKQLIDYPYMFFSGRLGLPFFSNSLHGKIYYTDKAFKVKTTEL